MRNGTRGRTALLIPVFAALLALAACGKEETVFTHHEGMAEISEGKSFIVALSAVPEGHTASEYTWTEGNYGDPIEVGPDGSVSPKKPGQGVIAGTLKVGKTTYREVFDFMMHPARTAFGLDRQELSFVLDTQGMNSFRVPKSEVLRLSAEPEILFGENTEWTASDPDVVSLGHDGKSGLAAQSVCSVVPKAAGTSDVTVTLDGKSASCRVTVLDRLAEPENVLEVLSDRADRAFAAKGRSAFVCAGDIACGIDPDGTPGGGGKYAVLVDVDPDGDLRYGTGPDDGKITGYHNLSEYLTDGWGYTSLLPERIRAKSMDEVSFLIRVTKGGDERWASYSGGVQGYVQVIDVELVDALTGEVLETYATRQGKLDDHYWVAEGQTRVTSPLPAAMGVISSLYRVIADLWLTEYDNVSFFDTTADGTLFRYYGTGTVEIPEGAGIGKMNCKWADDGIGGFDVPDGVEIVEWTGWRNYAFRVPAGSGAEKALKKAGAAYTAG